MSKSLRIQLIEQYEDNERNEIVKRMCGNRPQDMPVFKLDIAEYKTGGNPRQNIEKQRKVYGKNGYIIGDVHQAETYGCDHPNPFVVPGKPNP